MTQDSGPPSDPGLWAPQPAVDRHKGSAAVLYVEPQKRARRWRDLVSLKLNS
jgi:hypothetical protein